MKTDSEVASGLDREVVDFTPTLKWDDFFGTRSRDWIQCTVT